MILYGKPVAEKIYEALKDEIFLLKKKKIVPQIAVILVGENPVSLSYVQLKEKKARELGVQFKLYHLPENVAQNSIKILIQDLNKNKFIHGIIIQLPLPKNFDREAILRLIDPQKDIDGFYGDFPAPTASAIIEILDFYKIDLKSKKIVLVGHGRLVGGPLEKILIEKGLKPIICDSKTKDLKSQTKKADILISATGMPGLIAFDMIQKNTIVIDAGTAELDGKLVGDVSPEVYQKAHTYTPTPGGVGPVTVAVLMKNLVSTICDQP